MHGVSGHSIAPGGGGSRPGGGANLTRPGGGIKQVANQPRRHSGGTTGVPPPAWPTRAPPRRVRRPQAPRPRKERDEDVVAPPVFV